jgi:molybdopterin synthase catalytic subunit
VSVRLLGVSRARNSYDARVLAPDSQDSWLALTGVELPVAAAYDWCVRPDCGAVVLFSGTVRDHALDDSGIMRDDVQHLEYEAYDEQVVPVFERIADELRGRWPTAGRVVIWHRTGRLALGESSVVVAVSAPHRPVAFEAARFAIDAVKASAPIWKRETWEAPTGIASAWGTNAHDVVDPSTVPAVGGEPC